MGSSCSKAEEVTDSVDGQTVAEVPPLSGFQPLVAAKSAPVESSDVFPSYSREAHSLDMSDAKGNVVPHGTFRSRQLSVVDDVTEDSGQGSASAGEDHRPSSTRRRAVSPGSRASSTSGDQSAAVRDLPPEMLTWLHKQHRVAHAVASPSPPSSRKNVAASPLLRCGSTSLGRSSQQQNLSLATTDSQGSEVISPQLQLRKKSVVIDKTW
jgi:hypothetical protein